MDDLRNAHYGPNATEAPQDGGACDAGCRARCLPLLDDTWSARLSGATCPARDMLLRCLLVRVSTTLSVPTALYTHSLDGCTRCCP